MTFDPGRGGQPPRDLPGNGPRAGILCAACDRPITGPQYLDAWGWVDPAGATCAAHGQCLRDLGEKDLDLGRAVR